MNEVLQWVIDNEKKVKSSLLRFGVHDDKVDDVYQELCVKFMKPVEARNIKSLVETQLRYSAINHWKRNKVIKGPSKWVDVRIDKYTTDTPESLLIYNENVLAVESAINSLGNKRGQRASTGQRDAVLSVMRTGKQLTELAQEKGVPLNTFKANYRFGLIKMRSLLTDMPEMGYNGVMFLGGEGE